MPCDNKSITPKLKQCEKRKETREQNLAGKHLILLLNREELILTDAHEVAVKKYTVLEEIPFTRNQRASLLTRITYHRERLVVSSRVFFMNLFRINSLSDALFSYELPGSIPNTYDDDSLYHQVDFELSRHLI